LRAGQRNGLAGRCSSPNSRLVASAAPTAEPKAPPVSPAEKVRKDLDQVITLDITEQPLNLAVNQLREQTKINFVLDKMTLTQMGVDPEQMPVTVKLKDVKVRQALAYAINRQAINQAETLGSSRMTYSLIPSHVEFFWQPPVIPYDLARAKQLLAEAGYPNGFDAGDFTCDGVHAGIAEPVANDLQAAGFRVKLRPLERAAYNKGQVEKKFKNLVLSASAAFGSAPTRIEAFVAASGAYVYGSYPDIDGLFREQATEPDKKRRETTLRRIQQPIPDKAMVAPIVQVGLMSGYGPRVEESGLGLITGYSFSAPYEDVRLKAK